MLSALCRFEKTFWITAPSNIGGAIFYGGMNIKQNNDMKSVYWVLVILLLTAFVVTIYRMHPLAEGTASSEPINTAETVEDPEVIEEDTLYQDLNQENVEELFTKNHTKTKFIRLEKDLSSFIVKTGESIILDLNGHTISNSQRKKDAIVIEPSGSLFLTGGGRVENSGGYALIFNEGECFVAGSGEYINDTSNYSIINHGYMALGGDVKISCLQVGSSLVQNGYYEYDSGDYRTGCVNGWEYPEMDIYAGDYSGGRISVKNSDAGICRIYGGSFHDADVAVLKNWATMDVYGGYFYGAEDCIVLGRLLKHGDRSLGDLRIHGGNFYVNENGSKALFGISGGTDYDVLPTHGDVEVQGGYFLGFTHWYSHFVSSRAVMEVSEEAYFDPAMPEREK